MNITGKKARILKGRGKGKTGVVTSCDAIGNVTIRTEDGKNYGPMPDWGNYVLTDTNEKHGILLNMVSVCIGIGSRKGFEYVIDGTRESVISIMMDNPKRMPAAVKKLENLGDFDNVRIIFPEHGGQIECTWNMDGFMRILK